MYAPRACLKIHSRHLHAPLRGIFGPNSVSVAHYASFIGAKSPTKCDAQLTESNFQTRPKAGVTRKIVVISDYLCYNRINSENVGNQYRKERKYGQSD